MADLSYSRFMDLFDPKDVTMNSPHLDLCYEQMN